MHRIRKHRVPSDSEDTDDAQNQVDSATDDDDRENENGDENENGKVAQSGMERQRDPLAQILFQANGRVMAHAQGRLLNARARSFFVNEAGLQESCVTRDLILPEPRVEIPPPSSGHAKTTATCSCVRLNGDEFDVRISNIKKAAFHIWDLVVLDPESDNIPKDLRGEVHVAGFRVMSLTKTALGVHRLVSSEAMMLHINAPQKCFKKYVGSERSLMARCLAGYHGQVFTSSFCEYEANGLQYNCPATIVLEHKDNELAALLRRKEADAQKQQRRKKRKSGSEIMANETPDEKKDERNETETKRGRKKCKMINPLGTPKITSFFTLNAAAAVAVNG